MCVIVFKSRGQDLPPRDLLWKCWDRNSDGAGIMYHKNNKVHTTKGFMTWKSFITAYNKLKLKKNDLVAIHFRITTSGGTNVEMCHPFPIEKDFKRLIAKETECDNALMHNGVLSIDQPGFMSDTCYYAWKILSGDGLINNINQEYVREIINCAIKPNRFIIMQGNGITRMWGKWETVEGYLCSNDRFKHVIVKRKTTKVVESYDKLSIYNQHQYTSNNQHSTICPKCSRITLWAQYICQYCGWDSLLDKFNTKKTTTTQPPKRIEQKKEKGKCPHCLGALENKYLDWWGCNDCNKVMKINSKQEVVKSIIFIPTDD